MPQQHHHAERARITDPVVHKRRRLHTVGSNAGPVEPGVLDPCEIWLCTSRSRDTTNKIFLCSLRSPLTRDRDESWTLNRDGRFAPPHNLLEHAPPLLIGCDAQTVGHLDQIMRPATADNSKIWIGTPRPGHRQIHHYRRRSKGQSRVEQGTITKPISQDTAFVVDAVTGPPTTPQRETSSPPQLLPASFLQVVSKPIATRHITGHAG